MPIGTGMSALACFLKEAGHNVIGSDNSNYYFTVDSLLEKDILILEYNETNITSDYIYIIGLSVDDTNIELSIVKSLNYEYYYYNDFIASFLTKNQKLICVAGTHGKTTTSYLIHKMTNASCIVGCGYGRYTNSPLLVVEACEYQDHFLVYNPDVLVITSIDYDHPDYFKNIKAVINSFNSLARLSKVVIINKDLKYTKYIKHNNIITFGLNEKSDYQIKIIEESSSGYSILLKGSNICRILHANLCGLHNLYNFVASYVTSLICLVKTNLASINLPIKRNTKYIYGKTIIIDDYAHHPKEIESLYNSIHMEYPNSLIKVIFQPHTYSRTITFKKDFIKALSKFDQVYIMDVFTSSREAYDIKLQSKIDKTFKRFDKFKKEVINQISKEKEEVWVFLGAGSQSDLLKTLNIY